MVTTAVLGFPRIGPDRELKFALEALWRGEASAAELEDVAARLRRRHLADALSTGVDVLPSNDFSLYDHVLDTAVMVGAIPARFRALAGLERLLAMARGTGDARPLEMTKWLDTNYHHPVPEVSQETPFAAHDEKVLSEFEEALEQGVRTRPVLLGPASFLLLSRTVDTGLRPLSLLDRLVPVYAEILSRLATAGASAGRSTSRAWYSIARSPRSRPSNGRGVSWRPQRPAST